MKLTRISLWLAALTASLAATAAAANPLIVSLSHTGALPGQPTVTAQIKCVSNNTQLTAYYQRMQVSGSWGPTQYITHFWCKPPVNSGAVVVVTKSATMPFTAQPGEHFRFRVQQGGQMSPWYPYQF